MCYAMPDPKIDTSMADVSSPLTSDYTIFWTRDQLFAWYLAVKNRVIEPPKIRRQTPKPPRHEKA